MLNTVVITIHAVAATVAFAAGVLSVPSGRFLGTCRRAMAVMGAALVPAVLVDWETTPMGARIAFAGLLGLAGGMVLRAELAARQGPALTGGPTGAYLEHLGFTLIGLADGFAVVTAIRSGAPGWAVGVLAVGVVGAGHLTLQMAKWRLVPAARVPVVAR